jgi:hypothetical protein
MTITLTREEAQQVLNSLLDTIPSDELGAKVRKTAIETLRARLSAPEPEPVAWAVKFNGGFTNNIFIWKWQAEDEMLRLNTKYPDAHRELVPIYTAPPQREWQGLTDQEAEKIVDLYWNDPAMFIDAIEQALREKNT